MLKRAKTVAEEHEPAEQPAFRSNFMPKLQSLMKQPEEAKNALLDLDGNDFVQELTLLERAKLFSFSCSSIQHQQASK